MPEIAPTFPPLQCSILTAAWDAFLSNYEKKHRPTLGPLRPNVFTAVRNFLPCGDLASGFLRFHCPDCGRERLLAFTCKGRHLYPAPPKQSARSMRPLWRDMILKVWGADPLQCPCCKAPMKLAGAVKRPEQIEYSLLTSVSISCNPKADWYGVCDSVLNSFSGSTACGKASSNSPAHHRRLSTSKTAEGL